MATQDQAPIYRFKFTDEIMQELTKFAKIHQYDDRANYKEAWTEWLDENEEMVRCEVNRLTGLNYEGDIIDKMYKSARYYFRKKSTSKADPKQRRDYITMDKKLLEAMDDHVNRYCRTEDHKPSEGFEEFCKNSTDVLKAEIERLLKEGISDHKQITAKFKKTYKNRYYQLTH